MIAALRTLALTIALWGLSSPAFAQTALRTWVSVHGTDSGLCPATAPCRSLTYAFSQTASRGEIDVMDSGGYSTGLVITRSVSIVGTGALATILVPANATGIKIGAAGIDVTLNGLSIDGSGLGNNFGIDTNIDSGNVNSVTIKNCTIFGLGTGVFMSPRSGIVTFIGDYVYMNNFGIYNGANIGVIGQNVITLNSYGLYGNNNGSYKSYGNNEILNNTVDIMASITSVKEQ